MTYYYRGLAYEKMRESDKAIQDFAKVMELCGTDAELCQAAQEELSKPG
jgi:regulator of sirC expression with transglutaminase-like and TPR domain